MDEVLETISVVAIEEYNQETTKCVNDVSVTYPETATCSNVEITETFAKEAYRK